MGYRLDSVAIDHGAEVTEDEQFLGGKCLARLLPDRVGDFAVVGLQRGEAAP